MLIAAINKKKTNQEARHPDRCATFSSARPYLRHGLVLPFVNEAFCSVAAFRGSSVDWCRWRDDAGRPLGILLNDLSRLRRSSGSFRSRTQLLPFSSGRKGERFSLVGSSLEVKLLIDHYSLRPWNRSIKSLISYITVITQGLDRKKKKTQKHDFIYLIIFCKCSNRRSVVRGQACLRFRRIFSNCRPQSRACNIHTYTHIYIFLFAGCKSSFANGKESLRK